MMKGIKESKFFIEFHRHWIVYTGFISYLLADALTGSPPMKAREIVLLILVLLSGIRIALDEVNNKYNNK